MKLEQRIFRINILFLLLSLLTMLAVTLFAIEDLSMERRERLSVGHRMVEIERLLENVTETNFEQLATDLAGYQARLSVRIGERTIFSTVEDEEEVYRLPAAPFVRSVRLEDEVVMSRAVEIGGELYHLYALVDEIDSEDREWEDLVLRIFLIGGATIFVLLGLNLFFTRRLLAAILAPLKELAAAIERITAGRYDQEIDYKGDKEFTLLTDGVNQMQARLLASQQEKALYEQNRTQMVAAISHDLRTPLTSIKGYSKGILDGVADKPEKQQQYVEVIYQKSQLMEDLLETLFVFSQLEREGLPLKLEKIDLAAILSAYVAEKQQELADQPIRFELDAQGPIPVELDRLHFRRILDNLLDNASKYAGVTPLVISLTASVKAGQAYFSFADNGMGVPADKLPYLFDEFYRVDEARQLDGHGLGLAIVKQIIDSHGGQVWVDQQAGLVFHFSLPLDKEMR